MVYFKWVSLQLLVIVMVLPFRCYGRCNYSAVFNFGDSSSDTGSVHTTFPFHELAEQYPYGRTFFGKPTGRYSDGRLSLDFFMQALGLPFLSPFLQSVASNFGHGANFAAAGATVRDTDFIAPISLSVQLNQFKVFKQQVLDAIDAHGELSYLPTRDAFTNGIYSLEIGGNDFSYGYMNLKLNTSELQRSVLPLVARGVAGAVQELYDEGARTFLIRDVGPQGCQPFWLSYFPHQSSDFDKNGCSISYNNAVQFYNRLLRSQLSRLRNTLANATIIYINTFDVIYDFFAAPSKYGFEQTLSACCGVGGRYNYTYSVQCGSTGNVDGRTMFADSCKNPSVFVNWDGVHWTDEANRLLTRQIISGNFFEPSSFSLASYCDLQPI